VNRFAGKICFNLVSAHCRLPEKFSRNLFANVLAGPSLDPKPLTVGVAFQKHCLSAF
jgi:hypothetical protein